MTPGEMAQLLAKIIELDPKYKALQFDYADDDNVRLQSRPPATLGALTQLAARFPQGQLPPSYAQLLLIHDGIKNFNFVDKSLLSIEDLLYLGDDGRTQREAEKEPDMIFFIVGTAWNGVAFDRKTVRPDGEMDVVRFNKTGATRRWKTLPEFLLWYLEWLEKEYAKALADRKNLEDT